MYPNVTYSPSPLPQPLKSKQKTVIFKGSKITAEGRASTLLYNFHAYILHMANSQLLFLLKLAKVRTE